MRISVPFHLPDDKADAIRRARRLEWLTIFFLLTITAVVFFTMGSSQAMKTAWIEDVLSLIPPIVFLVASRKRDTPPNERFPYGYERAFGISFLAASFALLTLGLYMVFDSTMGLVRMEHPTLAHREILGVRTWAGWWMIAALIYSAVPPFILGRMKLPLARELDEKTLQADADMNKADWMTAGAAVGGILGIGMGLWWADSAAALFISLDVTFDGFKNMKRVVEALADREPTDTDGKPESELLERARVALRSLDWVEDAQLRVRDEGLPITGEAFLRIRGEQVSLAQLEEATAALHGVDWRFYDLVVTPVRDLDRPRDPRRGVL